MLKICRCRYLNLSSIFHKHYNGIHQVLKLQAAIKYGEEDLQGAKVSVAMTSTYTYSLVFHCHCKWSLTSQEFKARV